MADLILYNIEIDEVVQLLLGMDDDDLRRVATQLAAEDSPRSDRLADMLLDAVFDATQEDSNDLE